jgi:hypothetical protein
VEIEGGIKTSLAYFHQFVAEVTETLVSFGVLMQVFRGEAGYGRVQYSFLLFKQPSHL